MLNSVLDLYCLDASSTLRYGKKISRIAKYSLVVNTALSSEPLTYTDIKICLNINDLKMNLGRKVVLSALYSAQWFPHTFPGDCVFEGLWDKHQTQIPRKCSSIFFRSPSGKKGKPARLRMINIL